MPDTCIRMLACSSCTHSKSKGLIYVCFDKFVWSECGLYQNVGTPFEHDVAQCTTRICCALLQVHRMCVRNVVLVVKRAYCKKLSPVDWVHGGLVEGARLMQLQQVCAACGLHAVKFDTRLLHKTMCRFASLLFC